MDRNHAIKLDGFGRTCFCVEDDPYEGILNDEQVCETFLAPSLDEFWLKIRNR